MSILVWTIIILVAYLIFMLWIGNYAMAHETGKTEADYFVTGWKTSWIGISFSIAATFASGAYVLGTVGVFYGNPAALTGYAFGTTFAPFLLWMMGRRIWAIGRKYGYATFTDLIGDFYQSEKLRVVVSVLICLFFTPYLAVNFMAPAILFSQLSGGAIPFWVSCLVFGLITTYYTYKGGMRAVIWTDIAQTIIMLIGFAIIIPTLFSVAGGWSTVWQKLPESITTYKPGGASFWIVLSWFWIVGFMQTGNPDRAFRLLVASDLRQIRKGCLSSLVLLTFFSSIGFLMGWALLIVVPGVAKTDLAVGEAINKFMPYMMPVLMVTLWAAGMSTLDSGLIAISAMISKDVYRRNINRQATDAQVYKLGQWINVVVGALAFLVAIMNLKTLWFFVGSTAAIAMQWTPLILGALYWKRATTAGAWTGFLAGVGLTAFYYYLYPCPIPGPGGPAIIGFIANVILFVVVSLATQPIEQSHVAKFQGIFRTA
jgi:solute:Na+ symporter, SSS family